MVTINTVTCSRCGTIVAGNVLEDRREMKCPRLTCEEILRFSDLSGEEREQLLEHAALYEIEP